MAASIAVSSARSSPWSGSSSWTCRKRSPPPTSRGRRGRRPCRRPSRARSSRCRGRRAARPAAAGRGASRAAPGRPARSRPAARTGRSGPRRVATTSPSTAAASRVARSRPRRGRRRGVDRRRRQDRGQRGTVALEPPGEGRRAVDHDRARQTAAAIGAPSSASSRSASARASTLGLEPRPGAGRAARVAAARRDQVGRAREQLGVAVPQPLRQPDPAGDRLVQVDRRLLRVRRADLGDEAEVARVDHQRDGRDGLDRPAGPEQRDVELVPPPAVARRLGGQPVGGRLELELGQVDGTPADVLVGHELQLLEQGHEARDHHLAVDPPAARRRRLGEHVERLERHRPVGVGVVVDVDAVDVRLALVPLEPVDVVLDRFVDVDRPLVDEDLGAEQVDLAEDPRPVRRRVDDHDVLRGGRPQRDLRRREVLARPVPAPVAGLADVALLGEEREQVVGRRRPEHLARLERQLERRGAQVGEQDVEVVRVAGGPPRACPRAGTPGGG